jgi:cytochrome b6-f complex iron-sulfur subunit
MTMIAPDPKLSRRSVLTWALKGLLGASGLLAFGGLLRFFDYQTEPPRQTAFDAGPVADLPQGSRTVIAEAQAVLLHDAGGFRALSLVCPHLGCQVEPRADDFTCPCHGSRFNLRGERLHGPAPRGLRALRLEIDGAGHAIVHTD